MVFAQSELYKYLFYLQLIFDLLQGMEQVLRKLYQDHYKGLQRKRLQKVLQSEQYVQAARKKYDFSDQISRKTRETGFSIDQDIRFQKQFQANQTKVLHNLVSIQAKYNKFRLPGVVKRELPSMLRQKFKAAVTAVIFIDRLKRKLKGKLMRRKRKVQKMSGNLVGMIEKMLRNYYQKLLQEQLINYIALLQKKLQDNSVDQQKQSIQLLYYISQKLASSSIIKELMEFFVHVATNQSFQPNDFLSAAEISRLDFSCLFGCTINVTQEQTRMIIGLGLGIKIFCFYILYQPWNISFSGKSLKKEYKQIKETINNFGSVFYYLLFEQFCLNLKEVRTLNKSKIVNLSTRARRQLDAFNQGETGSSSKALISGQTRFFLNNMELKYPNLLQGIKDNIIKWISRISYACLKQSEKRDKLKDQTSTFSSTISVDTKEAQRSSRRVFKSVQLTKKRDQLQTLNLQNRYNFPKVHRTLE